jgi:Protein of unknown function (DUF2721).
MEALGSWLIPLTYLPGIGMLILSTSHRSNALDSSLASLLMEDLDMQEKLLGFYVRRTMLFRNALIGLYVSLGFFMLSSILGIMAEAEIVKDNMIRIAAILGTLFTFYGVLNLIWESYLSMKTNRARCLATPSSRHYVSNWKPPWQTKWFKRLPKPNL